MWAFLSRKLLGTIDLGPRLNPFIPPEPASAPRITDAHEPTPAQPSGWYAEPRAARIVDVQPIRRGDPLWWANGADPSCPPPPEGCGGDGRVSRMIEGERQYVACVCFDEERANS